MSERLLDVHQTAELLGVKPSTVYKWAYERRLPYVKLRGTALRFKLSVLEKIIKEDERPALRSRNEREGFIA